MFCPGCGFWVRQSYEYCPGCGKQLSNSSNLTSNTTTTTLTGTANQSFLGPPLPVQQQDQDKITTFAAASNPLKRPLTFEQFNAKKSEERQGLSFRATKKGKSRLKANKQNPSGGVNDVTINIGMMVAKLDGKVDPLRGKGLPLKIKKDAKSDEILQAAINKRIDFDRSFRSDYLYRLLYPDGQEVVNLPGSNEPFSLLKYKEALGKTFARITLYLGYNEAFINEANETYSYDDDDDDDDTALMISPFDLDNDINDIVTVTADSANPALNNKLTANANSASNDVINTTAGINASRGIEKRDELISPISSLRDRSKSQEAAPYKGSIDEMYAALLFNEVNADFIDLPVGDESFITEEDSSSPQENCTDAVESTHSIAEILRELSKGIDSDKISNFNISRNHIWEGAKRAMSRKSFNSSNKLSVKFTDDIGNAEGAVDQGGPTREFFTMAIEWLLKCQMFVGNPISKFISLNALSLEEGGYFMAGQIFAMSLVHGGPSISCLAPECYKALLQGVENAEATTKDVFDYSLRVPLEQLLAASTLAEANDIISTAGLDIIFDMAGTLQILTCLTQVKALVKKTLNWYVFGRAYPAYESFKKGLSALDILPSMVKFPKQFRAVFCYNENKITASNLNALFSVHRGCDGSSKKQTESLVLSHWEDFLQDAEEEGSDIQLSEVLFFCSGCKAIPPHGLSLSLEFLHEPEEYGSLSLYPKANTCGCVLYLPVVHKVYETFKEHLVFAFQNARGFGIP